MKELQAMSLLKSSRKKSESGNMQMGKNSTVAEFEKLNEEEVI